MLICVIKIPKQWSLSLPYTCVLTYHLEYKPYIKNI